MTKILKFYMVFYSGTVLFGFIDDLMRNRYVLGIIGLLVGLILIRHMRNYAYNRLGKKLIDIVTPIFATAYYASDCTRAFLENRHNHSLIEFSIILAVGCAAVLPAIIISTHYLAKDETRR